MDNKDCRWPVAIGTTESGEGRVFDYSKASNILVAGASSRIPVSYRFNKEKYNELKAKGFRLEF